MTSQKVPPLSEREKPGLSKTLTGPIHPLVCQGCGAEEPTDGFKTLLETRGARNEMLQRWRECDEFDKPTRTVVVLCAKCSKREIDRHPRLYIPVETFAPEPGIMDLCVDCRLREGVSCKSPLAKHNGGSGMAIDYPGHTVAHFNYGGGRGEFRKLYKGEATACAGRELGR
jgi:hypothetical protein